MHGMSCQFGLYWRSYPRVWIIVFCLGFWSFVAKVIVVDHYSSFSSKECLRDRHVPALRQRIHNQQASAISGFELWMISLIEPVSAVFCYGLLWSYLLEHLDFFVGGYFRFLESLSLLPNNPFSLWRIVSVWDFLKNLKCKHNVTCIATPCGDAGNRMLHELSENFYACEILIFVFGNSWKCYPVPQLEELRIWMTMWSYNRKMYLVLQDL